MRLGGQNNFGATCFRESAWWASIVACAKCEAPPERCQSRSAAVLDCGHRINKRVQRMPDEGQVRTLFCQKTAISLPELTASACHSKGPALEALPRVSLTHQLLAIVDCGRPEAVLMPSINASNRFSNSNRADRSRSTAFRPQEDVDCLIMTHCASE